MKQASFDGTRTSAGTPPDGMWRSLTRRQLHALALLGRRLRKSELLLLMGWTLLSCGVGWCQTKPSATDGKADFSFNTRYRGTDGKPDAAKIKQAKDLLGGSTAFNDKYKIHGDKIVAKGGEKKPVSNDGFKAVFKDAMKEKITKFLQDKHNKDGTTAKDGARWKEMQALLKMTRPEELGFKGASPKGVRRARMNYDILAASILHQDRPLKVATAQKILGANNKNRLFSWANAEGRATRRELMPKGHVMKRFSTSGKERKYISDGTGKQMKTFVGRKTTAYGNIKTGQKLSKISWDQGAVLVRKRAGSGELRVDRYVGRISGGKQLWETHHHYALGGKLTIPAPVPSSVGTIRYLPQWMKNYRCRLTGRCG